MLVLSHHVSHTDKYSCTNVSIMLLTLWQIVTFNNKANDVSLRVSAIDYLGVVAAHLRKDAVNSQQDTESITEILVEVTETLQCK